MGKRVVLEERNGVVGKKCTMCGEWKALDVGFHASNDGSIGGRYARCKECRRKIDGSIRRVKRVEIEKINEITGKKCTKCDVWKPLSEFANATKGLGKRVAECNECRRKYAELNKSRIKEYQAMYRIKNAQHLSARERKYKEINRDRVLKNKKMHYVKNKESYILRCELRRARKNKLPNTLTLTEKQRILLYFDGCSLTGEKTNIHLDHTIPLTTGHGGTVYENIIPLRGDLNISKWNNNFFEWFDANKERFILPQERFDNLIDYLSEINGMSVQEYRDYVYWCHANPRNIDAD